MSASSGSRADSISGSGPELLNQTLHFYKTCTRQGWGLCRGQVETAAAHLQEAGLQAKDEAPQLLLLTSIFFMLAAICNVLYNYLFVYCQCSPEGKFYGGREDIVLFNAASPVLCPDPIGREVWKSS